MTYPISEVTRRVVYSGSSGVGPYPFTFEILEETDIGVYKNDNVLTLTTDYTVTVNEDGTGSVTLVSAATASDTIAIFGNKGIERQTDFTTGGDLFATSLNDEFDAQTIFAQQNSEAILRSIRAPVTDPTTIDMELPKKDDRKGRVLGFDDTTGDPVAGPPLSDVETLLSISNDIALLADIQDGTVGTDVLSDLADIADDLGTVGTVADDISLLAGIATDIERLADIEDGTLATDAIQDVAAVADEVVTVADNIADVVTVATDLNGDDTIGTVAASIADINRYAEEYTISATEPVSPSEGDLWYDTDNNTFNYYDGSSWRDYSGEAAASLAGVEALYDAFDDRYLGSKASDPTLDNDGNALTDGALYFDTTLNVLKVYDLGTTTWLEIPQLTLASLTDVTLTSVSNGEILRYDGISQVWVNEAFEIVNDATPQLGGTLDANGNDIDMGTNTITDTKVGQWDTAYGWGDHAAEGYLKNVVEDTTPQLGGTLDTNGNPINDAAGVNLQYGGNTKISTTETGADITGTLTVNGVEITGSGSVITELVQDTTPQLGGDLDVNGKDIKGSQIDIRAGSINLTSFAGSETYLSATELGAVTLGYSGNTKLATTNTGVDITGSIVTDGASLDGAVTINESGADVDFRIESDTNANAFFLDGATGNVGIQTSDNTLQLNIGDSTNADGTGGIAFVYDADGTVTEAIFPSRGGNGLVIGSGIKSSGTTSGDFTTTQANTGMAAIRVTSSSSSSSFNHIAFYTQSISTRAIGTEIDDATVERMRITHGGNVGIGTTSPTNTLNVSSSSSYPVRVDSTSSVASTIRYSDANTTGITAAGSIGDDFYFLVNTGERMRIDSSGNVGIGTSTPTAKLSVDGSAVFNESGADVDFRIESDTKSSAFFLDGATGRIGLRNTSPDVVLSIGDQVSNGDGTLGVGFFNPISGRSEAGMFPIRGQYKTFVGNGLKSSGTTSGSYEITEATYTGIVFENNPGESTARNIRFLLSQSAQTVGTDTASPDEVMRIDRLGNVGIGTTSPSAKLHVAGDAYVSGGIYLGGTGAANYLDDYEEGTWTPTELLSGFTTSISSLSGDYTKVGRVVTVNMLVTLSATGRPTAYSQFGGMPFSSPISATGAFSGSNPGSGIQGGSINKSIGNTAVVWYATNGATNSTIWKGTVTYFTS